MRLNNLELDAFRGATVPVTIHFNPEKKITMIFAENGNGKSTISDALTCLLTEDVGSISDKSETDLKYLKSVGKDPAKITLNTSSGAFSATISGNGRNISKNPSNGLPLLKTLRRKQIINLIEAKAAERYKELKSFIDVDEIFKCEAELRKTRTSTERELTTTVTVISKANETLENAWSEEGKPETDFLTWAAIQSGKDISNLERDTKKYDDLKSKWEAIVARHNSYRAAKTKWQEAQQVHNTKLSELQKVQNQNPNSEVSLLELLEQAKSYIEGKPEVNECPVCSNNMQREEVVSSLSSRITAMNALKQANEAVNSAKQILDAKQSAINNEISSLNPLLISYKEAIVDFTDEEPAITTFVENISEDSERNLLLFQNEKLHLDNLALRIIRNHNSKTTELKQHNLIKSQFNAIKENEAKAEKLQSLLTAAAETLEIVETSRKEFVENELNEISGEVDRMYNLIHPNEEIGAVTLSLKDNALSSLVLEGKFHTEEGIPPQSVYSESHLDTLGICIFLALAKKYGNRDTILVLDDVVMSVDEKHLDRFIELLHSEADSFGQIIITTHYRPWRDRYRNNRAPNGNVHFLELRNWSLENGIRVYNGKLALQELKAYVDNEEDFNRENIASASGRMLENILDFLSLKFRCKMPRNPKNEYTLADLLNGFSTTILPLLKVEHFSQAENNTFSVLNKTVLLRDKITELKQLNAVRNQVGAHYNFDGALVSDDDVLEFGRKTIEFAELLICPENGNLPTDGGSGSYWKTKKGTIKLYPYATP